MAELRQVVSPPGHANVMTYIQSGNMLFTVRSAGAGAPGWPDARTAPGARQGGRTDLGPGSRHDAGLGDGKQAARAMRTLTCEAAADARYATLAFVSDGRTGARSA
jgi:hypothetical protein